MNREEAREYMRIRPTAYLRPGTNKGEYICPLCGSGSGKKGSGKSKGITSKDGVHFSCWKGCFTNEDIIDIIGREYRIEDYNEKLAKAAELFGITIDGTHTSGDLRQQSTRQQPAKEEPKKEADRYCNFTDFFLQAHEHINETDYHRGLSPETLERFKVGYVAEWKPQLEAYLRSNGGVTSKGEPKNKETWEKLGTTPRLIIPISQYSYTARLTEDKLATEYAPKKQKVKGAEPCCWTFNYQALRTATKPIYIVEGEIDAMSIVDVGGEAIGLGSVAYISHLCRVLEQYGKPKVPFIIALDNDAAGAESIQKLSAALHEHGINSYEVPLTGGYKDANEMLMKDREALKEAVKSGEEYVKAMEIEAKEAEERAKEEEKEALRRSIESQSMANYSRNFIDFIKETEFTPTGSPALDKALCGGFTTGLYVIGAVSSLGKTTFLLQLADQLAALGTDVLYYSLEMGRYELMAKSISRLTLTEGMRIYGTAKYSKSVYGVIQKGNLSQYTREEKAVFQAAADSYEKYADHLYIIEGNRKNEETGNVEQIGTDRIRADLAKWKAAGKKAPVVMIDYLQILKAPDIRLTDKQATDMNVTTLRSIARDYGTSVIGISSFNRDNYDEPVNLTAFKESGAIEYSSDVLIGLQYEGMDYRKGEKENERKIRIRELKDDNEAKAKRGEAVQIQVKLLKQRLAPRSSYTLYFTPVFNHFGEAAE